jgi:hypothetical protein
MGIPQSLEDNGSVNRCRGNEYTSKNMRIVVVFPEPFASLTMQRLV